MVRCGDDVFRRRGQDLEPSMALGPVQGAWAVHPCPATARHTLPSFGPAASQTTNVGTELRCAMRGAAWGRMRMTPGGRGGLRMIPYRGINERLLRLAPRLGMAEIQIGRMYWHAEGRVVGRFTLGSSGHGKVVICYPKRASAVQTKATQEVRTRLMHTAQNRTPCAPDYSTFIVWVYRQRQRVNGWQTQQPASCAGIGPWIQTVTPTMRWQ